MLRKSVRRRSVGRWVKWSSRRERKEAPRFALIQLFFLCWGSRVGLELALSRPFVVLLPPDRFPLLKMFSFSSFSSSLPLSKEDDRGGGHLLHFHLLNLLLFLVGGPLVAPYPAAASVGGSAAVHFAFAVRFSAVSSLWAS